LLGFFKVFLHGLEIERLNIIGSSFGGGFLATKFAVKSKRKLRSLFFSRSY
jgi:hypothetical protein